MTITHETTVSRRLVFRRQRLGSAMKRALVGAALILPALGFQSASAAPKKPEMPVADYEKLILAFKDASFDSKDFYRIDHKSDAVKALADARKSFTLPKAAFVETTLKNESAPVRAKSVELLSGSFFGTSSKNRDLAVALMAEEKDPGVRAALLRTFSNDGGRNPAIGEFIMAALGDSDPVIRDTAVVFCIAKSNMKIPGFIAKLADMLVNDPDAKVRMDISTRAGKLGDAAFLPSYEKALNDTDKKAARAAFRGLIDMWWAFPFFDTANADAYKLTLATIQGLKADDSLPGDYFSVFSAIATGTSIQKTRDAWAKNTADFYNAEEVRAALMPFAESPTVNFMIRNSAFKGLYTHGMSKDDVLALAEKVKPTLTQFNANALDNALKQLK